MHDSDVTRRGLNSRRSAEGDTKVSRRGSDPQRSEIGNTISLEEARACEELQHDAKIIGGGSHV
jgi:hypothetical protein